MANTSNDLVELLRDAAGDYGLWNKTLGFQAADEIEQLTIANDRYEFLRCVNPREFIAIWEANIKHGLLFDDIVDKLRAPPP